MTLYYTPVAMAALLSRSGSCVCLLECHFGTERDRVTTLQQRNYAVCTPGKALFVKILQNLQADNHAALIYAKGYSFAQAYLLPLRFKEHQYLPFPIEQKELYSSRAESQPVGFL